MGLAFIPKQNLYELCYNDCNHPLNLDQLCNSPCNQICPIFCTLFNSVRPIPPFPSVPPLILDPPITDQATNNVIATILPMITAVLVAAFTVWIFLYFLAIIRRKIRERIARGNSNTERYFSDEDGWTRIWPRNPVGVQQSVIDLIAVFKYKKDEFLIGGSECAVCLAEFQEDESLKLLPKCSHAFHAHCIDTWLTSQTNCPLCRAPIVSPDFNARDPPAPMSSSSNEDEVGTSEARNEGDSNLETKLNIRTNIRTRLDSGQTESEEKMRLMRSASLDSSSVVSARRSQWQMLRLKDLKEKNVSRSVAFSRMMKSSSIEHMLQKGQISMKRSYSSTTKASSSTRHSESYDSILPL